MCGSAAEDSLGQAHGYECQMPGQLEERSFQRSYSGLGRPTGTCSLQVGPRPCERQVQLFAKGHSNQPNRHKETTSPGSAKREVDLGLFECRSKTSLFSLFL